MKAIFKNLLVSLIFLMGGQRCHTLSLRSRVR